MKNLFYKIKKVLLAHRTYEVNRLKQVDGKWQSIWSFSSESYEQAKQSFEFESQLDTKYLIQFYKQISFDKKVERKLINIRKPKL